MRHFMQIVIVLIKSVVAERGEGNKVKATMVCDPEARVDISLDWTPFELALVQKGVQLWVQNREEFVTSLLLREDDEAQFLEYQIRDWLSNLEEEGRDDVIKTTEREHYDCRRM